MVMVAPSILSADFGKLGEEVKKVEAAGANMIHIDVMDGHFVPNITVGPLVVKAIREATRLTLEAHLMIENPDRYIPDFARAGADLITVHTESSNNLIEDIELIKQSGKEACVSLNPATPLGPILPVLGRVRMVLCMTVNPGFEAQKFMPEVLPKIKKLKSEIRSRKLSVDVAVDGGINLETAPQAVAAGANVLIAGSAIYHARDFVKVIKTMKGLK